MSRFTRIYLLTVVPLLLVFAVLGVFVVPALIRQGYAGESFSFLNKVFSGRDVHSVDRYLGAWSSLFRKGSIALAGGALLLYPLLRYRTSIAQRLAPVFSSTTESALSSGYVVLAGVAFGLLTGYAEAIYVIVKTASRNLPNWGAGYSSEVIWNAPLVYAVMFGVAAALVSAIAFALRRRTIPSQVVVFTFVALASYCVFRSLRIGLHPLAVIILGFGLAFQLGRAARANPRALRRTLRWWTGGATAVGAAAAFWLLFAERSRGVTGTAPTGAPNVLLIILDTVRAASLGLYGNERPTSPNIDLVASTAMVFDRALSTAPWTLPSHGSMFTGRLPYELSTDWEVPLDGTFPTVAELLSANGYRTGGFIGNEFYTSARSGLERGFQTYKDHPITFERLISNTWGARRLIAFFRGVEDIIPPWNVWGRKNVRAVNSEFLRWVSREPDTPFFAFLNYMDAHHPYQAPAPFDTTFSGRKIATRIDWHDKYSPEELAQYTVAYDQTIKYVDTAFGEMMTELRNRGLLNNTLVIITSDHGEQFGERTDRDIQHGRNLYYSVLHVPLVVALPGGPQAQRRIAAPVSLRDLPSTILQVTGVPNNSIPGASLARFWTENASTNGNDARTAYDAPVVAELRRLNPSGGTAADWNQAMRSVLVWPYHYIRNGNGDEELYDVQADRWERTPMTTSPATDSVLQRFRGYLPVLFTQSSPKGQQE
jgi:arylsulfatase A-like enzyme